MSLSPNLEPPQGNFLSVKRERGREGEREREREKERKKEREKERKKERKKEKVPWEFSTREFA